jgi:hypothetical protein
MATPLQQLANRTANNKARHDALNPFLAPATVLPSACVPGAAIYLRCASAAVLTSIPTLNRTDGMLVEVDGDGIFQFAITSTTAPSAPWVYRPDDVAGGSPGRWFRLNYGAVGVAGGIAQLDSGARIAAGMTRAGGNVAFGSVSVGNYFSGSATYVDLPGASITFPGLQVGDVIVMHSSLTVSVPTAQDTSHVSQCYSRAVVTDPTTTDFNPSNSELVVENADVNQFVATCMTGMTFWTVATAGTHTLRWQVHVQTHGGLQGVFSSPNFMAYAVRA